MTAMVASYLVLLSHLAAASSAEGLPSSPNALEKLIVTEFPGASACILLLHIKGQSGCRGTAEKVPLMYYSDRVRQNGGTGGDVVLVVEEENLPEFLANLASNGSSLARSVKGGLIVRGKGGKGRPSSFSPADVFPHKNFAPYTDGGYEWNPSGLGLLRTGRAWPPLYVLTEEESEAFREMAEWNRAKGYRYPQYVADLTTEMLAADQANTFECLDKSTCLPIGGYSVASSLPPPTPASASGAAAVDDECVLVLAQVGDSNVFHGLNKGAESSISGMVAAAAAYEAVARSFKDRGVAPSRRLAFALVGSEGYGLSGSRRLVHDLGNASHAIAGCHLSQVSFVVEVGPVGLAAPYKGGAREYYLHWTPGAREANQSIYSAFEEAADDSEGRAVLRTPVGTPGIPPSSLMSFSNHSNIRGLVLADFERRVKNPYLSSYMDDGENYDVSSVYIAAELVAGALVNVAFGGDDAGQRIDRELLNSTVVGLSDCLLTSKPGMQCDLVQRVADSYLTRASLYPGIVSYEAADDQSPNDKTDLVRFLWGYLATRAAGLADLSDVGGAPPCDYPSGKLKCPLAGQVCARWRSQESGSKSKNGRCVAANVQYAPAWSHHLTYTVGKDGYGKWGVNGTAGAILDEIWTESYWPPYTPTALVYMTEGFAYELGLFLAGSALTVCWFYAMGRASRHIAKELKQT